MGRARSERHLERNAIDLASRYAERFNWTPSIPVPVEMIAERLCGLTFDWRPLPDDSDLKVYAALYVNTKVIAFNANALDVFKSNEGMYRFTVAHELGHWELHVDPSQQKQSTLFDRPDYICRTGDHSPVEQEANRFAAALLMPAAFVQEVVAPFYQARQEVSLADQKAIAAPFGVSTAACRVRLCVLRWAHEEDGVLVWGSAPRAQLAIF